MEENTITLALNQFEFDAVKMALKASILGIEKSLSKPNHPKKEKEAIEFMKIVVDEQKAILEKMLKLQQ